MDMFRGGKLPSDRNLSKKIFVKSFSCPNSMAVQAVEDSFADRINWNGSSSNSSFSRNSSRSSDSTTTISTSYNNNNNTMNKTPASLLFQR